MSSMGSWEWGYSTDFSCFWVTLFVFGDIGLRRKKEKPKNLKKLNLGFPALHAGDIADVRQAAVLKSLRS